MTESGEQKCEDMKPRHKPFWNLHVKLVMILYICGTREPNFKKYPEKLMDRPKPAHNFSVMVYVDIVRK